MKVLVNGGLNLSELDGWWAEAYAPEVGWALGDGQEHGDDPAWDAVEAEALYTVLEQELIPAFYSRDASGIPTTWVARMRESVAQLVARFSANRTVREYTEPSRGSGPAGGGADSMAAVRWPFYRAERLSILGSCAICAACAHRLVIFIRTT